MKNPKVYAIFTLIIGLAIGYALAAPRSVEPHEHNMHAHDMLEWNSELPAPSLAMNLYPDPKSGYNLQLTTSNFTFAPNSASTKHVDGEGHTHLFINSQKITRLYGEWTHIPADWLQAGQNEIMVTLSTNDHKDYAVSGELVSVSEIINYAN